MKNSKHNVQSRQYAVLDFLRKNNYSKLSDIAQQFGTSEATVRRDVLSLIDNGEAVIIHGGMCIMKDEGNLPKFDYEPYFSLSDTEKDAIAKKAAELIDDGDTVFLDSSSTAFKVIEYIKNKSVIVITNNGRSLFAKRNPGTELIVIGGEVAENTAGNMKLSITGGLAIEMISSISASKAIIGASGVSAMGGLTAEVVKDPPILSAMLAHCNGKKIVVADYRKIGLKHNFRYGSIEDITDLVTDSKSDPNEIELISKMGVNVIIAD